MINKKSNSLVSDKVNQCQESVTLALSEKTQKLRDQGESIISFGTGEPDFFTPDYICDAGKKAIDERHTKYDAVAGVKELREAVSKKLREENGLDYSPKNILISSGAKSNLYIALQTILNPGDEVILIAPYWVSYVEMVRLAGGVPVIAETQKEEQFKLTPEELIYCITPRTKAIILNTPVNPTGAVYTLDELLALAEVLTRNQIITISDEIYEEFVYDNRQHISIASLHSEIKNLTILINGFSKTFAMTGWRLGYAAANDEIINGMKKIQGHTLSHPSTISQYAGIAALENQEDELKNILEIFNERRHRMIDLLNEIHKIDYLYPEGAFYIFVDISELLVNRRNIINPDTSYGFSLELLENAKVVVVPGEAFGMKNYIRLSFAASLSDIEEGIKRLAEFIEAY